MAEFSKDSIPLSMPDALLSVGVADPADGAADPINNGSCASKAVLRSRRAKRAKPTKRTPWLVAAMIALVLLALVVSVMRSKDDGRAGLPDQEKERDLPAMGDFSR